MNGVREERIWRAMLAVAPSLVPVSIRPMASLDPALNKMTFDANLMAELSYGAAVAMVDRMDKGEAAKCLP